MKRPWMPLYINDLLDDPDVVKMSLEEFGAYMKLLCYNWNHRSIPSDTRVLASMLRVNHRTFSRIWPVLSPLFPAINPGLLGNDRVMNELLSADEKSENYSRSAKERESRIKNLGVTDQITTQQNKAEQKDIYTPPLVPAGIDLGKPENKTQGVIVDRFVLAALPIFDALNAARKRVIQGARDLRPTYASLAGICGRLDAGKTAPECLAVIEACEAECKRNQQSAKWFDATSPWRPENFERKLAAAGTEIDRYSGFRAPMKHQIETKDETDEL